jgi:hypothetical protein
MGGVLGGDLRVYRPNLMIGSVSASRVGESMIRKSVQRFSEKIMLKQGAKAR